MMTVDDWYKSLPIVTRVYVTLCFLTTAGSALEVFTEFSIYFNARLIFQNGEFWRLFTNFFRFGGFGLDFVFHMFFLIKYSKALEEGSFRGRSADFLWMLLFGACLLVTMTVTLPYVSIMWLGPSLTFMMVYVWGRRNPHVSLSFLGIFTFTAPYLPWVLLGFSMLLRGTPIVDDVLGIIAGHVYFYLEDVYPRTFGGRRPLRTPGFLKALLSDEDGNRILRPVTNEVAGLRAGEPPAAHPVALAPGAPADQQ